MIPLNKSLKIKIKPAGVNNEKTNIDLINRVDMIMGNNIKSNIDLINHVDMIIGDNNQTFISTMFKSGSVINQDSLNVTSDSNWLRKTKQ